MEREQSTSKLLALPSAGPAGIPIVAQEALALINARFALRELAPEEVRLGRMALCNDAYDRTHERFSPELLPRLAETLVGKAVLAHHRTAGFPLGRFYAAAVERASDGTRWLMADYYALVGPELSALHRDIDAGIVSYVSIQVHGVRAWCDPCGAWWSPWSRECGHWPGEVVMQEGQSRLVTLTWKDRDGNAEAVEGSYVWLGAQYEAQVVKSLRPRARCPAPDGAVPSARCPVPSGEGTGSPSLPTGHRAPGTGHLPAGHATERSTMELKEALAEIDRLKSAQAGYENLLKSRDEEQGRLQKDLAEWKAEVETLQATAADGELYRADLVAEIGRLGRLVGAEKEARVVAAALAPTGVKELKAARDEYQARVDAAFPVTPAGQPATEPRENGAGDPQPARFGYGVL